MRRSWARPSRHRAPRRASDARPVAVPLPAFRRRAVAGRRTGLWLRRAAGAAAAALRRARRAQCAGGGRLHVRAVGADPGGADAGGLARAALPGRRPVGAGPAGVRGGPGLAQPLRAPGTPLHAMVWPLLLIGAGIGLPWGLMDGLAVSVVPRERAGMASGIFNTVRVAGEGIALALVGAGLTALVALQLSHLPGHTALAASQAAQRMTTGDLPQAMALLPGLGREALLHAYGAAFATLLCVLAAVTVLTALAVFSFLRGEARPGRPRDLGAGIGAVRLLSARNGRPAGVAARRAV